MHHIWTHQRLGLHVFKGSKQVWADFGVVFPDILRVPKQRDAFLVVGARPGTTPLRPKNAGSLQNAPGQHEVAEFPEGSAKTYILDYTGLYHMIKGIIFFHQIKSQMNHQIKSG